MSDAKVEPVAVPAVIDAQDPLPESAWLWRRIFVFVLTAALLAMVWWKIENVADVAMRGSETAIQGLVSMLKLCLWLIAFLVLLYLLAPSAEQLTKLVQTAKSLRSGVSFASTAAASGPDGRTVSSTVAGPVPVPPPAEPPIPEPSAEELAQHAPPPPARPAQPTAATAPVVDLSQQ